MPEDTTTTTTSLFLDSTINNKLGRHLIELANETFY